MREYFIQGSYLAASILFILGLRSLTRPDKARRGMQLAAAGMLFAVIGTLVSHQIVDYRWIAAGLVRPVDESAGVPLFDFHQVTAGRTLADLVQQAKDSK